MAPSTAEAKPQGGASGSALFLPYRVASAALTALKGTKIYYSSLDSIPAFPLADLHDVRALAIGFGPGIDRPLRAVADFHDHRRRMGCLPSTMKPRETGSPTGDISKLVLIERRLEARDIGGQVDAVLCGTRSWWPARHARSGRRYRRRGRLAVEQATAFASAFRSSLAECPAPEGHADKRALAG